MDHLSSVDPEEYVTMVLAHTPDNTFLGFVVETYSNDTTPEEVSGVSYSVKRNDWALVYGKEAYMWEGSTRYLNAVKSMVEVHATVATSSGSDIPSFVKNHGVLSGEAFHSLLKRVKLFLGLGFPYEGPAPLEAIANGAVYLNPRFLTPKGRRTNKFFAEKPTLREVHSLVVFVSLTYVHSLLERRPSGIKRLPVCIELDSQNPYAEHFIGTPYVITVDISNETAVREAVRQALNSQMSLEAQAAKPGLLHLLAGSFSSRGFTMAQILLERGEDPNKRDEDGLTPVHVAALWGNYEMLKLFLSTGGNPELSDNSGRNCFDLASEENQVDCLRLLRSWQGNEQIWHGAGATWPSFQMGGTLQASRSPFQNSSFPREAKNLISTSACERARSPITLSCCSPFLTLTLFGDDDRKKKNTPSYSSVSYFGKSDVAEDRDDRCSFVERRNDTDTVSELETTIQSVEEENVRSINPDTLRECLRSDCETIHHALVSRGVDVGPVTEKTKWLYARKLALLLTEEKENTSSCPKKKYSPEMNQFLEGNSTLTGAKSDEKLLMDCFSVLDSDGRRWREGLQKMSFCYLLLDSTLTRNLPERSKSMNLSEAFEEFLNAIFYVGKGKKSRPYHHLLEAAQSESENEKSAKVNKILELWNKGRGVISVHVFHNIIPVEAYTREAAMIDAIGLFNLTNIRKGDYYGLASTWTVSRKRKLGIFLLERAMNIFFLEGERELFLRDIEQ